MYWIINYFSSQYIVEYKILKNIFFLNIDSFFKKYYIDFRNLFKDVCDSNGEVLKVVKPQLDES